VDSALATQIGKYLIDPGRDGLDSSYPWPSIAFVDLDACAHDATMARLPPFPVVGIGDPRHPLVSRLDAVIEAPILPERLIRQAEQRPHASAALVQLLRTLEGMSCEKALVMESLCYGMLQGGAEFAAWLTSRPQEKSPASGAVRLERREAVLHVVLDRPWARNAIDREMRDQLFDAFTLAAADDSLRAVKMRAVGTVFSAGGDLSEFGTTRDPATAHLIRSRTLPAAALARRADIVDVHVQGPCVGAGIEMAAFASRVTAAPDAWFQLPEVAMGLIPGAGGCVSVPRRIGRQRAALMMLSGQQIDAPTALRWGLIDAIESEAPVDEGGTHVR
jgi:enoyl-CoA hydratase/carnithine racemase